MNKTQMYFIWMVAIEIIRNLMYMKKPSRQALFWMDKDENNQTTYEFAGIFTPTAHIGEQHLEVCTKYADNLECTF